VHHGPHEFSNPRVTGKDWLGQWEPPLGDAPEPAAAAAPDEAPGPDEAPAADAAGADAAADAATAEAPAAEEAPAKGGDDDSEQAAG